MEYGRGGTAIKTRLAQVEESVVDYFGMLNEMKMGLKPSKRVDKPEILNLLENCDRWKMPPVAGGMADQPWLLMQELQTARNLKELLENISPPGGQ